MNKFFFTEHVQNTYQAPTCSEENLLIAKEVFVLISQSVYYSAQNNAKT